MSYEPPSYHCQPGHLIANVLFWGMVLFTGVSAAFAACLFAVLVYCFSIGAIKP